MTETIIPVSNIIPVSSVRENDVLLGRGGSTNKHEGNKRYRAIVSDHQPEYLQARKKEKVLISRRIVDIVHENGGRFLKMSSGSGGGAWEEVPDKRAQEKTSQALREGLDVRNQTSTTGCRTENTAASASASSKKRSHCPAGDDDSTGSPTSHRSSSNKRAKIATSPMVSPTMVSVGEGDFYGGNFPSHFQLHDSSAASVYFAAMPPARPVSFLHYRRELSKSDVTDACAV